MPIKIKVDDNAYQQKLVTLNGNSLFITFSYNTKGNWYFDVVDRSDNPIVLGVKILPSQNLSGRYITLTEAIGGAFFCIDTKQRGDKVTGDNFGTDKQFQFWYYTNQEIEDIKNESTV